MKNLGFAISTLKLNKVKPLTKMQLKRIEDDRLHEKEYLLDLETIRIYKNKMSNAKDRGIRFRLLLDDIKSMITCKTCAYTGVEFTISGERMRTIERINASLGYESDNTVAVTKEANNHKSQLDAYMHGTTIPDEMKLKLLRKSVYQLEKNIKGKTK